MSADPAVPTAHEEPGRAASVLTIPNLLSILRLALVPVFLYFLLVTEQDALAVAILVVSGVTDWLDGKLARAWGQTSRLGELLDPVADRLYIVATLVAFVIRDILPWWFAAILVGRDLVLTAVLPMLRWASSAPLPVHFLGKAATFNLLAAFPLLLLGDSNGAAATLGDVFGWALLIWGTGLYLFAAMLYLRQAGHVIAAGRRAQRARRSAVRET